MKFSIPKPSNKTDTFGEPLWEASLEFRCPICKQKFESKSYASTAAETLAGQRDEDGYAILICSVDCLIEQKRRTGQTEALRQLKESIEKLK